MSVSHKNRTVQRRQVRKVGQRLRRLQKAKKLKRYMVDAVRDVKDRKHVGSRKRALDIKEDWILDREEVAKNEENDEILPLDMLDADIDWENSAFAANIRRLEKAKNETEIDDIESKRRKFRDTLEDNEQELLPIKVGTKVIRQTRIIDESVSKEDNEQQETEESGDCSVDLSELSAAELLKIRHEHVEEAKDKISSLAHAIIADPQVEVQALKHLYLLCIGEGVHSLARETVMKIATVSLAEVFVDIIPGYIIRSRTEEELAQKLKKETRKLYDFEQTLLRYYLKYLQHLEKYAGKLCKVSKQNSFDQLAIICTRCLSRILVSAPHFNYASNIISFLVRLTVSNCEEAVDICCNSLGQLFYNDLTFRVSAIGAKFISSIVNKRKGNVPPSLIATFLKLKVKVITYDIVQQRQNYLIVNDEVDKSENNQEKKKLMNKKRLLNKEKKMKSKNKFAKQLKKLQADLKEAEATESASSKLSFATETMNHVFATYFRVIKRLPTTRLLEPVLEGLAKFAHLINVEFFDDMISALASLVNQQHLRLIDSVRCIYTVFVMLSGEGIALNIDPSKFYWSLYRLLPTLAFERHRENFTSILMLTLRTLDLMITCRRKQVPVFRVAAFTKRLLAVAFFMPSVDAASILLCVRSFFIAYPKLDCLVEDTDEVCQMQSFKPEIDDPDCCSALTSSIIAELLLFVKHPDRVVSAVARYLQAKLPSAGPNHLPPKYSAKKAYDWYEVNKDEKNNASESVFIKQIDAFAKKQKIQLTSKTLHSVICKWIESKS
ncbi:unnamed protein product [Thelazia callipaeda]|uniref:NOC3-like protein n=1 Tax=Thelazia callipaeda TaxID=103827 RepID=A0A0N5CUK4_THECL|nr:unnamed protein product [Thelazia callipaeda]